ncbi:MAG: nucleotide exchange factor GrpE [Oscillospiraceae bacterium]|nr:nucleotide exchange factor GrpE [Oscillospiraceae bacterium]MBQ9858184.1 nucleotide exchange factor GrpE [Oscillospiraceae bacterium]
MNKLAKEKKVTEEQVEETVVSEETAAEETPAAEEAPAEPTKEELLEAELAAEHDKFLRLAAEYDNFRKRTQKEREALYTDVKANTVASLLPVYDNLERALAAECTDEAFYKGVEMTMTQLKSIFESIGVSEIPAVGEKFDPNFHNAVMQVEAEGTESGTIVAEFQKGFKLGDKIIRFSMVQVAN